MKIYQNRSQLLEQLNQICIQTLKEKPRLIVALTGLCGSGKSTLGKTIRKKGFGNFAPYQIAVIDDNVMSLNLFIARPKIRNTPPQHNLRDNLKPFTKFLPPYVKIIFYICANPVRIDFADVVIILKIDEQRRQKQLEQRESDAELIKSLMNGKINIDIPFTHGLCLVE